MIVRYYVVCVLLLKLFECAWTLVIILQFGSTSRLLHHDRRTSRSKSYAKLMVLLRLLSPFLLNSMHSKGMREVLYQPIMYATTALFLSAKFYAHIIIESWPQSSFLFKFWKKLGFTCTTTRTLY